MTLDAIDGETVQHRPRRRRPIHDSDGAELFVVRTAFIVDGCLAMERCCDPILKRSAWKQITSQLCDHELIVR